MKFSEAAASKVITSYGYSDVRLAAINGGYRNAVYTFLAGEAALNMIIYKSEPGIKQRIKRLNSLGVWLHGHLLPVRYPLQERIAVLYHSEGSSSYACVYNVLPGETIPWEAYTMKHIKLLGWALGDIHHAARELDSTQFPRLADELHDMVDRMGVYFGRKDVARAMRSKLELSISSDVLDDLDQFVDATADLEGQILHMDFVRGNVLFSGEKQASPWSLGGVTLSGVIDFEKTCVGHQLFDIARTLAFLYVDCSQKTPRQIKRYFIDSGYNKRSQSQTKPLSVKSITGTKYDVLESAIRLFLLYDLYKFLRSNPYEFLQDNYHYRRTRDILLDHAVVRRYHDRALNRKMI